MKTFALSVAAVVLACFLSLAGGANVSGAGFTVNSLGDEPDAVVGNGVCATAVATCTLRAAIQEAGRRCR